MAGPIWVLDIMWHALLLARDAVKNYWSSWSMEFLVVFGLLLHIALTILAECRWRRAKRMVKFLIWLFYAGAKKVGATAIGNLSISSASGDHQLVAFWGGFFLLYLGLPDSISAYSIEDNDLSWRDVLEAFTSIAGAAYVVWASISSSWTLATAAWLMLVLGAYKYAEKTVALYHANLDNIRSSSEKKKEQEGDEEEMQLTRNQDSSCRCCYNPRQLQHGWTSGQHTKEELLLFAHSLFENIVMHALVDASDVKDSPDDPAESTSSLLNLEWEDMCKVVEIQLSLMYDILYAKAAMIHTGLGYCIRVCSPIFTAAAFVLFELSNKDGDRRADVVITRILLAATLLLETVSLLRALGSSWAVASALLCHKRQWRWLHHAVLCTGRWHRLHRVVSSLTRIFGLKGEYRRWSGRIGEFNLLNFCSTRDNPDDIWSSLAKMVGVEQEDWWIEFRHSRTFEIPYCVKMRLFKRIKKMLENVKCIKSVLESKPQSNEEVKEWMTKLSKFRTQRGEGALLELKQSGFPHDLSWSLGDEIQEGILTWHIATHVYLFKSNIAKAGSSTQCVKAIKTLSNYMMYLLAFRPDMLPGLPLRSLYKLTCQDLFRLSSDYRRRRCSRRHQRSFWDIIIGLPKKLFLLHDSHCSPRLSQGEEILTSILCGDYTIVDAPAVPKPDQIPSDGYQSLKRYLTNKDSIKSYISLGSALANQLLEMDETKLDLLEVIFNVWVEMLLHASYRCTRESHAKQLSSGGELTSVVWLMVEHAGLFPIDKVNKDKIIPNTDDKGNGPGPENKKVCPPCNPEHGCGGQVKPPHITPENGSNCAGRQCICCWHGTQCICCSHGTQCICGGGTDRICGDGTACIYGTPHCRWL